MSEGHGGHIIEGTIGAAIELAKQGGAALPGFHPHGAARLGQLAVQGAAAVAPVVVVKAGALTVAGAAASAAGAATAATAIVAAAPVVLTGAALYGLYRLLR